VSGICFWEGVGSRNAVRANARLTLLFQGRCDFSPVDYDTNLPMPALRNEKEL
jgi:hypothetical protein